jgi:hypothetical protein
MLDLRADLAGAPLVAVNSHGSAADRELIGLRMGAEVRRRTHCTLIAKVARATSPKFTRWSYARSVILPDLFSLPQIPAKLTTPCPFLGSSATVSQMDEG